MPYDKPEDKNYNVISSGGKPFQVWIEIDEDIWEKCSDDLQASVLNILNDEPIRLIPSGGHGNGIKQESKGIEFHTQTDRRLQAPNTTIKEKSFNFNKYGKAYGH